MINHVDQNEFHIDNTSQNEINKLQTQVSDFENEVGCSFINISQICRLKEELERKEKERKETILIQSQQFQQEKESILQGI